MPCYACATKLLHFKAEYFSLQEHHQETIEDILLASSAIPLVFLIQEIENKTYWDGFITDNTHIKPLAEEGCNIIIAVMLIRSDLLSVDEYPNCKIIPIYPQDDPGKALNFNNTAEKMQKGYTTPCGFYPRYLNWLRLTSNTALSYKNISVSIKYFNNR